MTSIFARGWSGRCALFAVLLASITAAPAAENDGFHPLIESGQWSEVEFIGAPAATWSWDGAGIRCTGVPNGYIATKRNYRNFVLRVDFRYPRPPDLQSDAEFAGNSGYLLYITGEPKVWPQCVEVQGQNREVGRIFAVGGAPRVVSHDNPEARAQARRPVGEWNQLEIESKDGAVVARLNGVVVCTSEAGPLRDGPIGIQSEGREIHFRNVQIKELP